MSGRHVRAAVVQAASVGFDRDASIEKLRRWAMEASEQGAQMALFPEAFVGGYPRGLDFGAVVGSGAMPKAAPSGSSARPRTSPG